VVGGELAGEQRKCCSGHTGPPLKEHRTVGAPRPFSARDPQRPQRPSDASFSSVDRSALPHVFPQVAPRSFANVGDSRASNTRAACNRPEGDITRQVRDAARRVAWLARRLELGNAEASGAALSVMARPCQKRQIRESLHPNRGQSGKSRFLAHDPVIARAQSAPATECSAGAGRVLERLPATA
jgi:hypothetical protein